MNLEDKERLLRDLAALMVLILEDKVSAFAYGVAYHHEGIATGYDYHFRGDDCRLAGIVSMMASHIRAEDAQK